MAGTTLAFLSPCEVMQVEAILKEELAAAGLVEHRRSPGTWLGSGHLNYTYWIQSPACEIEPEALVLLAEVAGTAMCCEFLLYSCITDAGDAQLLGGIAQRVAARTRGWVFIEFEVEPSAEVYGQLNRTGRGIRFDGDAYLDAAAMAAWMAHPDYHFVK